MVAVAGGKQVGTAHTRSVLNNNGSGPDCAEFPCRVAGRTPRILLYVAEVALAIQHVELAVHEFMRPVVCAAT